MISNILITVVAAIGLFAAAPILQKPQILSTTQSGISDEMIGSRYPPMSLKKAANDPNYGYSEKHPVMVQGGFGEGGHNVYRFLNALRGPKGEAVHYRRIGTCCEFKTKKSPFGGKELLEVYEVTFDGGPPKRLYFNWYDDGDILIPVGFTGAK